MPLAALVFPSFCISCVTFFFGSGSRRRLAPPCLAAYFLAAHTPLR
jgi:hypothetical protein